jgi:quinone-modifying oxidoreductase subunit QmoC
MPSALVVRPDTEFIHGVIAGGGGDVKKCFQCATCSSVCSLSSEDRPFPRKQVLEAQWGLKDELMGDPAVWLCHDCGDCTVRCPRGARPSAIMGAIRREAIKSLAVPRFMGSIVSNPRAVWLLFLLPMLVLSQLAAWPLRVDPGHSLEFAYLFPQARVEALFFTLSALVLLAFITEGARFRRVLRAAGADGSILSGLFPALSEVLAHRRFSKCSAEAARYWGHLLVLYGFVGLAIMGTIVGVGSLSGIMHTPLPLLSPLKIFANLCALIMLLGVVIVLLERFKDREKRSPSTYFDWFFLLTLAAVLATGIASELLRLEQDKIPMFVIYFVHLSLIFALFLYAPYSKFAHLLYRTLAMAATWEGDKRLTDSDTSYTRSLPPAECCDNSAQPEAPSQPTSS